MNKFTRGAVLAGALYTGANALNTPEAYAHHSSFEQTCDDATIAFEDMAGHPYLKTNMPSVMVNDVVVVTLTQDEVNQGKVIKTIDFKPSDRSSVKTIKTSWGVDWNGNSVLDEGESYGETYPVSFDACKEETPVTTTTRPAPTTTTNIVPPTTTVVEVELAPPQEPVVSQPQAPEVSAPITPETELALTGGELERNFRYGVLTIAAGLVLNKLGRRGQSAKSAPKAQDN